MTTREQMIEVLESKLIEMSNILIAIDTVLEENPEVERAASRIFVKYAKVFIPMMTVMSKEVFNLKLEMIRKLETEGFTKDQAIKLVVGK